VPVTLDPGVLVGIAALCVAYGAGARRRPVAATPARVAAFVGAILVLLVALVSPVDRVADDLFSVHMTQHLLLGLLAPLLLVLAAPVRVASAALDRGTLDVLARWTRARRFRRDSAVVGVLAVLAHAVTFWAWHAPVLYEAAVRHPLVHALEHATLFGGGVALWAVVLPAYRRGHSGMAIVWLFVSGMQGGALAALLTLAPRALYRVHGAGTAAWGTTPLDDQRLAGAVMWLPGGLVYAVAAIVVLLRWLDQAPRRAPAITGAGA
jgi:putative membrane protein